MRCAVNAGTRHGRSRQLAQDQSLRRAVRQVQGSRFRARRRLHVHAYLRGLREGGRRRTLPARRAGRLRRGRPAPLPQVEHAPGQEALGRAEPRGLDLWGRRAWSGWTCRDRSERCPGPAENAFGPDSTWETPGRFGPSGRHAGHAAERCSGRRRTVPVIPFWVIRASASRGPASVRGYCGVDIRVGLT